MLSPTSISSSQHFPSPTDLLPLFIGITGHRDLRDEDIPLLRETVRREFQTLKARYRDTPLIVLSPLGEGADRVVARVALEEGLRLIVPLPMPLAMYQQSFSSEESRAEFTSLLDRASEVFTLPWLEHGHEDRNSAGEPTPAQIEGQYAAMGAYIARYSHVLLALWDGDDSPEHERTGGTAQIVRFRLHGAPPPYGPALSLLERAGYGAVHHVITPRKSRPLPHNSKEPFTVENLPEGEPAEDFHRLDLFNEDVQKMRALMGAQAQQNGTSLVSASPEEATLVPWNLHFHLAIYGWSDTLSSFFARHTARTTKRIFQLVFLAAFAFNLFHSLPPTTTSSASSPTVNTHATTGAARSIMAEARETLIDSPLGKAGSHTSPDPAAPIPIPAEAPAGNARVPQGPGSQNAAGAQGAEASSHEATTSESQTLASMAASAWSLLPWFLWAYLILVAVNVMVHNRAEKAELQNKYQDYRALAEGLRVQIYWRMAGLREDVTDHYLGKQRGELNWIRHAIKSCNVLTDATNRENSNPHASLLPLVVQRWAREQRDYYVGKAHREHKELERQEKLIGSFVLGSVLLSLAFGLILTLPSLLPLPFLEPLKHFVEAPLPHALIMIAIVMSAVIAGLLHGYNTQLARAEHTKRYGRMGTLFAAACVELEAQLAKGNTHKTSAILHELGREALAENGDWVLLHRERPLEVPHAG